MIVRILGEGQYDLDGPRPRRPQRTRQPDRAGGRVRQRVMFRLALEGLLAAVRSSGTHHDLDSLDESDLILPPPDATIDEVRELLGDDGLIPG